MQVAVVYCRAMRDNPVLKHIPISVDTFDAEVAQEAVHAGAHMVNDVSGGLMDPNMHATVRLASTFVLLLMIAPHLYP